MRKMLDVVFDMETHDPDDFLTLLFLLGHPQVHLKAVTITPGTPFQVGLVRRALSWFGVETPVGAHNLEHPKPCVSSWHARAYGELEPSWDAGEGGVVLHEACDEHTTLVTGAPLRNLGAAMKLPGFRLGRWVAQGGFAGVGVMPEERQLPKFRGLTTCPTYNLNGDPPSALAALEHEGISARYFVSKNICHGVIYGWELHHRIKPLCEGSRSLSLIWQGMQVFLQRKQDKLLAKQHRIGEEITADEVLLVTQEGQAEVVPHQEAMARAAAQDLVLVEVDAQEIPVCRIKPMPQRLPKESPTLGKKFHDPLAACCAIDPSIATWAEVTLFREKGRWGSRLAQNSQTWIITDLDRDAFFSVLTAS